MHIKNITYSKCINFNELISYIYNISISKILTCSHKKISIIKQINFILILLTFSNIIFAQKTIDKLNTKSNNFQEVEYTLANNYFVKNTYPESKLNCIKIKTKETLDQILGMATTMGANGKPTEIDFTSQFAIAIIHPTTKVSTNLKLKRMVVKQKKINISLKIAEGETQTFESRPFLLLIVDKKCDYSIELKVKNNNQKEGN